MEIVTGLLLISFMLFLFWRTGHRPKHLPPGPRPLPLVGTMLYFHIRDPLKDFRKFTKKYGPIYSLYMGEEPVVYVEGFSLVKEVLLMKGTEFAGRPDNPVFATMTKKKGIITAPYGQAWKEQRKFALMSLRSFGLGKKSIEDRISDEAAFLVQQFEENMNVPFDASCFIDSAVTNIISIMVLGKRFKFDDPALRSLLALVRENTKEIIGPWAMVYNAVPFLRGLPLPHQNIFKSINKVMDFFSKAIKEHRETFVPGHHRDILDDYLEEIQKPENKGSSFETEYIRQSVAELFVAGLETTTLTLLWSLLYMMAFPDVQEKCQAEIDAVLGNNTCIEYEDRHKLPYTNAVIHEVQRFASVLPMGVPHAPTKDVQLCGYTIPEGTTLLFNLFSVLRDESQWKYPHEFNPSNFLTEKGEFVKPEAFLPFSAGPRACLGENLARMELFLFFTNILRRFQVLWPDETKAPDLTPKFGVTMTPSPFKVALKRRLPM